MSKIFTTKSSQRAARAFMHDIAVVANVATDQRTGSASGYGFPSWNRDDAKEIMDEIVNRSFKDIDVSIDTFAYRYFKNSLTSRGAKQQYTREEVAMAIVYFAELLGLYWDDTLRTSYELDEFKKTYLGAAVFKYGRHISAISDNTPSKKAPSSTRASGQPPKNNYKQSGGQSGNVRDLQDANGNPGTPGQKVSVSGGEVFRIVGKSTNTSKIVHVHIKPLSKNGAANGTNKVYVNTSAGYSDCSCYFDSYSKALDFFNKVNKNVTLPTDVYDLEIVRRKANSNGYFFVGTELGQCMVEASKLNEALSCDELEEGYNWGKVMENMDKDELADLTKWARRG